MVAWHGLSSNASATEPPKALVPMKAVLTLKAGERAEITGGPPGYAEYSDWTTMNSGEKLGGWWVSQKTMTPYTDPQTGKRYVDGPGTITFSRVKEGW
ncbi:MAG: hypothetical protein RLZZ245_3847 [Verrucomicrobiota bacterium]|jgi:hypothetical protein